MTRRFKQIDVFGAEPYTGNPVAVVVDGEGLSVAAMQEFTRWMNLSESAFLLPPTTAGADYRVRIFTPARELSFAGHPTLGSCHAWLEAGGTPGMPGKVMQECEAGLVAINRGDVLAFAAPPLVRSGAVEEGFVRQLAEVLGSERDRIVDAQWVDNGPGWVGVLLEDAAAVLAVEADFSRYTGAGPLDIGLVGPCDADSECAFEVRALTGEGDGQYREDPVTGSLNASLAQWLVASGRMQTPCKTSQGTVLGRQGRPHIDQDADGNIRVGGTTLTCIDGEVEL